MRQKSTALLRKLSQATEEGFGDIAVFALKVHQQSPVYVFNVPTVKNKYITRLRYMLTLRGRFGGGQGRLAVHGASDAGAVTFAVEMKKAVCLFITFHLIPGLTQLGPGAAPPPAVTK